MVKLIAGILTLFLFVTIATVPTQAKDLRAKSDGKFTCLLCSAEEGFCSNTCTGAVCVKAIEHQGKSERRYCMDYIEPNQPLPGECKEFRSPLGHVETLCACVGHYCNSSPIKLGNDSIMTVPASSSISVSFSMLLFNLSLMISLFLS